MKGTIYSGSWSKSKDFISIPRKMEPSSCSVILDSCSCLTMIKDIKSIKMTCQDNTQGFLGDQHLSSELLLLSAVFLYLPEIALSNKDCILFSVLHNFFSFSPEYWTFALQNSRYRKRKMRKMFGNKGSHKLPIWTEWKSKAHVCKMFIGFQEITTNKVMKPMLVKFLHFCHGHAQTFLPCFSSPIFNCILT